MDERTALGAAVAAGIGAGVWPDAAAAARATAGAGASKTLKGPSSGVSEGGRIVYSPNMAEAVRARHIRKWNKAVERALGWEEADEEVPETVAGKASLLQAKV